MIEGRGWEEMSDKERYSKDLAKRGSFKALSIACDKVAEAMALIDGLGEGTIWENEITDMYEAAYALNDKLDTLYNEISKEGR